MCQALRAKNYQATLRCFSGILLPKAAKVGSLYVVFVEISYIYIV